MLSAGGAGENDLEDLIGEDTDAGAEGHAVLCVEVQLVQRDKVKDPSPVQMQYASLEYVAGDEILR